MRDIGPLQHRRALPAVALKPSELEAGQEVRLLAHVERPPRVVARRHGDDAEGDENKP
jgi:hypothetical protein